MLRSVVAKGKTIGQEMDAATQSSLWPAMLREALALELKLQLAGTVRQSVAVRRVAQARVASPAGEGHDWEQLTEDALKLLCQTTAGAEAARSATVDHFLDGEREKEESSAEADASTGNATPTWHGAVCRDADRLLHGAAVPGATAPFSLTLGTVEAEEARAPGLAELLRRLRALPHEVNAEVAKASAEVVKASAEVAKASATTAVVATTAAETESAASATVAATAAGSGRPLLEVQPGAWGLVAASSEAERRGWARAAVPVEFAVGQLLRSKTFAALYACQPIEVRLSTLGAAEAAAGGAETATAQSGDLLVTEFASGEALWVRALGDEAPARRPAASLAGTPSGEGLAQCLCVAAVLMAQPAKGDLAPDLRESVKA